MPETISLDGKAVLINGASSPRSGTSLSRARCKGAGAAGMANGFHGSLERTPGALFRAMGALLLQKEDCSREALARELKEHLETLGVDYHVRTLKRQLTGSVASVLSEVEGAMRHVLIRANGLRTDLDIEKALGASGLWVPPEDRQPEYVSSERIVPLAQLWLLFNPTGPSAVWRPC